MSEISFPSWCFPIFISRLLNLVFIVGFLNFTMMNEFTNLLSLLEISKFWSIIPFNSKPGSLSMMLCCRLFRINKNEWVESFWIPFPTEPLWKMRNCPIINTLDHWQKFWLLLLWDNYMIQFLISRNIKSYHLLDGSVPAVTRKDF